MCECVGSAGYAEGASGSVRVNFVHLKVVNMKFDIWRDKTLQRQLIVVATAIVILLIASHPELRLLVPVIDVLGIDVSHCGLSSILGACEVAGWMGVQSGALAV